MLSAPSIVTAPEGDVIDLAKIRLFLRIDGEDLDGEIADYVLAVAGDIESMTSTRFRDQVVELSADGFPDLLNLNIGPVNEVVAVWYRDRDGIDQLIDPAVYELFGSQLAKGVRTAPGKSWPSIGAARIRIALQVGYGMDLPPSLSLALKEAVRSRFDGTPYDLFLATVNDRIWL